MNNHEILNEEMSAMSSKRLRDAIHDIIVELKKKETIDVEELSNRLSSEFRITISPFFLDKFLDDFMKARRGVKGVTTFFTRGDTKWLGVRDSKGSKELRNALLFQKPNLAKHKRKLFTDDEAKKLEKAYLEGMKELNFQEDIIRKTLILQKPSESKDIMKVIYNDVIVDKKYYNTYDNCWKLMILLGKQYNLDRMTGWFKLAPQSVKDYYVKTMAEGVARIDTELKAIPKTEVKPIGNVKKTFPVRTSPSVFPSKPSCEVSSKENMNYFRDKIKYEKWLTFEKRIGFRVLVELIDGIKITSKHSEFDDFIAKTDELIIILIKTYFTSKYYVIEYLKKVGLAAFLHDWKKSGKRPKINDF